MKDKTTAGILALLVGGLGVHKFYLGRVGQGLLYFLLSWTFLPSIIAFFEGIHYLTMDQLAFDAKYNRKYLHQQNYGYLPSGHAGYPGQAGYPNPGGAGYAPYGGGYDPHDRSGQSPEPRVSEQDIYERLEKLNELRVSGIISEDEFAQEKQRLLRRL